MRTRSCRPPPVELAPLASLLQIIQLDRRWENAPGQCYTQVQDDLYFKITLTAEQLVGSRYITLGAGGCGGLQGGLRVGMYNAAAAAWTESRPWIWEAVHNPFAWRAPRALSPAKTPTPWACAGERRVQFGHTHALPGAVHGLAGTAGHD